MPQNPNRDYEYLIRDAMAQIIYNDIYFQEIFKNYELSETSGQLIFEIYKSSFLFNTISSYPSLSVYFQNEASYERKNILTYVKPVILIDVACQYSHEEYGENKAREESFMLCKDIEYTLLCQSNLAQIVNNVPIQISDLKLLRIEPLGTSDDGGNWTFINTMIFEINTPELKAPRF